MGLLMNLSPMQVYSRPADTSEPVSMKHLVCLTLFLSASASAICDRFRRAQNAQERELTKQIVLSIKNRFVRELENAGIEIQLAFVVRSYIPLKPEDLFTFSEFVKDLPLSVDDSIECEPFWWLWVKAKPEAMWWAGNAETYFVAEAWPSFFYPWQMLKAQTS